MNNILTIGESLAVFAGTERLPINHSNSFSLDFAGSESNTAIALARLGHKIEWCSRLGQDKLGHMIRNRIRGEGVNTSNIVFDAQHPTGLMIKEMVGSSEPTVTYYRSNSAASFLSKQLVDRLQFSEINYIHLTGITAIISDNCQELIEELFAKSKQHNITISFDPNIRQKLWQPEKHVPLLKKLSLNADILLIGEKELALLFGTNSIEKGIEFIVRNSTTRYIAIKMGANGCFCYSRNHGEDKIIRVKPYQTTAVDTIGAGDAFNAGFLHGVIRKMPLAKCAAYANAMGSYAVRCLGDTNGLPSIEELEAFVNEREVVSR